MTFQSTSNSPMPQAADLLSAAASAAGANPKAIAAANTLIDLAQQLKSGAGAEALAQLGTALLAQARPELAQAIALLQTSSDFRAPAASAGCFGNGIASHPQFGQTPLDFCSPLPEFMPPAIDPATGDLALSGIKFAEETRLLRFYSPLPAGQVLLIDSFSGTAGLSQPFSFQLNLLSTDASIPLKEMMAKNVAVAIRLADGSEAYINGYVECFGFLRADGGFAFYEAHIVPWFSFLTQRINSRIYQDLNVIGVIEKVFDHYKLMANYVFRISQNYEPESYIVQYNETDAHFVSRLMEQFGLFYYFEHSVDGHRMVISDDSCHSGFCPPQAAHAEVKFNAGNRAQREDGVTSFAARRKLHPSRVTLNTFDFKAPHGQRMIEADTVAEQGDVPFLDVYRGNPAFAYRNRAHGEREARRCLEEMEWQGKLFYGTSDCRGLEAGHTFKLLEHHWFHAFDNGDNDFLVVEVTYEARNNYFGQGDAPVYRNSFTALRRKIPYRPRIVHQAPCMGGPQTATVVGPEGAEIHIDEFGRIKVQFPWDRYGRHDEGSSCWIRVSQPLAGQGWGMITIPRVGQEVIVDFLEGDPARPIVTGRVFNADQAAPFGLPESAHVTALRSRSTPGGGGYNEVAMHDAKDNELLNIRAQKGMVTTVLANQMNVVHGACQANVVTAGSHMTLVKKNIDISSEDGRISLTAETDIVFEVGASKIRMRADGKIEVQGIFVHTVANVQTQKVAAKVSSSEGEAATAASQAAAVALAGEFAVLSGAELPADVVSGANSPAAIAAAPIAKGITSGVDGMREFKHGALSSIDLEAIAAINAGDDAALRSAALRHTLLDIMLPETPQELALEIIGGPLARPVAGSTAKVVGRALPDNFSAPITVGGHASKRVTQRVFKSLDDLGSLKGTGPSVGNLSGMSGQSVEEIIGNIPKVAKVRRLFPVEGGTKVGIEYKWVDESGVRNRVRIHDHDISAPKGSNSAEGWTARWQQGKKYYDPAEKKFAHQNSHDPKSLHFNPTAANNTHIPIQTPPDWMVQLMKWEG